MTSHDNGKEPPLPLTLDDLIITSTTEDPFSFRASQKQAIKNANADDSNKNSTLTTPAVATASSLPVTLTRSFQITPVSASVDMQDTIPVRTDCLIQLFGDRVLMGISQRQGKLGNYLLCQADSNPLQPKNAYEYEVSNLLGTRDDPLLSVVAQRLAQVVVEQRPPQFTGASLTLILGISLSNPGRDPQVFRSVVEIMSQLYKEAVQLSES